MTSIKDFRKTLVAELQKYSRVLGKDVEKASKEIAQQASKDVKKESRKLTGDYKKGWGVIQEKNGNYIVRNRTDYGLTHLLEKGHVLKDGTGRKIGDSPAYPHIKPAEEKAIKEFEKRIEEIARGR